MHVRITGTASLLGGQIKEVGGINGLWDEESMQVVGTIAQETLKREPVIAPIASGLRVPIARLRVGFVCANRG